MWTQVNPTLPDEIAALTTSVWLYPDIMMIGVMRPNFLFPPTVWGEPVKTGLRNLRKAPDLVDEWQDLVVSPVIFAEAELTKHRNQQLLTYLGFEQVDEVADRKIYRRSI